MSARLMSVPSNGHASRCGLDDQAAQGPTYVLEVSGGECIEDALSGRVTCTQPAVSLTRTAGGCNLPYTGPSLVQVWCAIPEGLTF